MSQALVGLNQIAGVIGSALFNSRDECLLHMMPAHLTPAVLGKLMTEVRNTLNVLDYLDDSSTWTAIVIRYEGGYLVVRSLHKMTVLVLAEATLNPAMLSVGFNVASLKLEKEGIPSASIPPFAPQAQHGHAGPPPIPAAAHAPHSGQTPAARASTAPAHPQPMAPAPSVASSSTSVSQSQPGSPMSQSSRTPLPAGPLSSSQGNPHTPAHGTQISQSNPRLGSMSGLGSSQGGHEAPAVPDAVGRPIVDALLKALAKHIGPFAKLIMKEELTKLGVTAATLGFSQYEDFVGLLGRRLQDPVKRREFMTEAEGLPHKL